MRDMLKTIAMMKMIGAGGGGGGGSGNCVTGTFTGETAGKAMDVTIPYSGNGYPLSVIIFPTSGVYKSGEPIYSSTEPLAIALYSAAKDNASAAPMYTSSVGDENHGTCTVVYKSNASDPTALGNNKSYHFGMYSKTSATGGLNGIARFKSATTMSVYIYDSGVYGFKAGVEYTYQILYSA